MGVDEALLDQIVHRVLSVAQPDRIILFGSAATGKMTRDSDIDLLVVEPAPANTRERSVEIRDAVGEGHRHRGRVPAYVAWLEAGHDEADRRGQRMVLVLDGRLQLHADSPRAGN